MIHSAVSSTTIGRRVEFTFAILHSVDIINLLSASSWRNLEVYFRLLSMNRGVRPTFYLHKTNDRFVTASRKFILLFRHEHIYRLLEGKEKENSPNCRNNFTCSWIERFLKFHIVLKCHFRYSFLSIVPSSQQIRTFLRYFHCLR